MHWHGTTVPEGKLTPGPGHSAWARHKAGGPDCARTRSRKPGAVANLTAQLALVFPLNSHAKHPAEEPNDDPGKPPYADIVHRNVT